MIRDGRYVLIHLHDNLFPVNSYYCKLFYNSYELNDWLSRQYISYLLQH